MSKKTRMVLDTDPGIDDAVALMLALASPEMDVVGLTTTGGNVGSRTTFENAHRLLHLFGRSDIPVGIGKPGPKEERESASHVHGITGLGATSLPLPEAPPEVDSVELLCNLATRFAGDLTLVAVGPLTNVARALTQQPDIVHQISKLIVMGGAVHQNGNVTAAAEFNIYMDPEAAAQVFASGMMVHLIPLDVTTQPVFTQDHLDLCVKGESIADTFFRDMLNYHMDATNKLRGTVGCFLHDALAVAAVFAPELLTFHKTYGMVETTGEHTSGMTLCDFREVSTASPNAAVALQVDSKAFLDILCDRIKTLLTGLRGTA